MTIGLWSGVRIHVVIVKKLILPACLLFACAVSGADAPPGGFQKQIRPVLEANCFKCHNAEKHKGGIDLAGLADD